MSEVKNKNSSENQDSKSQNTCIHCGDVCGKGSLEENGNLFCCAGCRAVYNLLHDNELDSYYTIEKKPGLRPEHFGSNDRFEYLNNEKFRDKLLAFNDGKTAKIIFSIPQIHCSSCIWLLENLFRLNKSIQYSRVDFQRREASITFKINELSLKELVILLASIGYEPELRQSSVEKKPQDNSYRKLYAQLAIAGFAFGNIMLLSFPEYLGFNESVKESYGYIFSWVKILLSLPVVFYSAMAFFIPAYRGIRQKYINMDVPVSIGIVMLFTRSLYDILALGEAGYLDSLCALVFLLLVGRLYQKKTYFSLNFSRDYRSYLPISITVEEDNVERQEPLENLQPGDRILIRNNEIIPADSILIKGKGKIDYSFVTGESDPVTVNSGSRIYAGGRQRGQLVELELVKTPSQSYLMQLWEQASHVIEKHPGVTTLANRMSRWFTPAILSLSMVTALFWLVVDSSRLFNAATAILIIACPCALALASPFTLGTAQRILGRCNLFIKDSKIIEQMAQLHSIVFDKTGTITQSGASQPIFVGGELTGKQKSMIYSIVRQSTHPLSVILSKHYDDCEKLIVRNFTEHRGKGLEGEVNGHNIRIGSGDWVGIEYDKQPEMTSVYISIDGEIIGYFRIANLFRKGLSELFASLSRNYSIALLTGDNDSERERLTEILGRGTDLHFNMMPGDKLGYVDSVIKSGKQVAMIGDGLNDAGALKASTVGISIIEKASSFFPACDGILTASAFQNLDKYLKFAGDSLTIIKVSMAISLIYNVVGLSWAVQGTLSPVIAAILMPASSVSVVLFTTLAARYSAKRRKLI